MANISPVGFNDSLTSFAQVADRQAAKEKPRSDSNQLVDREVVRRQADATSTRLQEEPSTQPERDVRLEGALARREQAEQREVNDQLSANEIGLYKDPRTGVNSS